MLMTPITLIIPIKLLHILSTTKTENPLKVDLSLAGEDCQHAVTDESLCTVTGCALGTDVCHWMFKTKLTCFKVKKESKMALKEGMLLLYLFSKGLQIYQVERMLPDMAQTTI